MLYIIGLGIGDEQDITLRGLAALEKCTKVYLESYTSKFYDSGGLKMLHGKKVDQADREFVENNAHVIISEASCSNVALLVIGDPFGATTHADLILRVHKAGVKTKVIHNASIINAIGCTGLQLYRFGQTVSVPFFEATWKPTSFLTKIYENLERDLHTLVLLDIRVKEQSVENIVKGNRIFDPARYMKVSQAIDQIVEAAAILGTTEEMSVLNWKIMGARGVGSTENKIVSGVLGDLRGKLPIENDDFLESLVVCAKNLHEIEQEWYNVYALNKI